MIQIVERLVSSTTKTSAKPVLSKNSAASRNGVLGTKKLTALSRTDLGLSCGSAGIEPDQARQLAPEWQSTAETQLTGVWTSA